MENYLVLAPAPTEEDCVCVGEEDYMPRAWAECQRFIALLRKKFGPEPEGARLAVKSFMHDFGDYLEVVCYFDETLPDSVSMHCTVKTTCLLLGMTNPAHLCNNSIPERGQRCLSMDSISQRLLMSTSDSSTNGPGDWRCP
jgi:hypothetical protein